MSWVFVDDRLEEAEAFAAQLSMGAHPLQVTVMSPIDSRRQLLSGATSPTGVLMDVELSNVPGELGSGPGIAQDLRVKQKAREIHEFPIVRFAARQPVMKNVHGDPVSDDLFDLKVQKEGLSKDLARVQLMLIGLREVYDGLGQEAASSKTALSTILGLSDERLAKWSHEGFHDRLLSSLQIGTHVAAGAFMRSFLLSTGLLIDEGVLSIRIGVDLIKSGNAWATLRSDLPFRYHGIASTQFERWWVRGLDDWWFEEVKGERPLASLTIRERIEALAKYREIPGLVPLVMPQGSPGERPWRPCALTLEEDPPRLLPVDPSEAVRLTPRADLPVWSDPLNAAIGPALQLEHDLRLNRADLQRLKRKYMGSSA